MRIKHYPGRAVDVNLSLEQNNAMGVLYEANWLNAHETIRSRNYKELRNDYGNGTLSSSSTASGGASPTAATTASASSIPNGISSLGKFQHTLEQIRSIEAKDSNITKTIRELNGYKPSTLRKKNRKNYPDWNENKNLNSEMNEVDKDTKMKAAKSLNEIHFYENSNNMLNRRLKQSQTIEYNSYFGGRSGDGGHDNNADGGGGGDNNVHVINSNNSNSKKKTNKALKRSNTVIVQQPNLSTNCNTLDIRDIYRNNYQHYQQQQQQQQQYHQNQLKVKQPAGPPVPNCDYPKKYSNLFSLRKFNDNFSTNNNNNKNYILKQQNNNSNNINNSELCDNKNFIHDYETIDYSTIDLCQNDRMNCYKTCPPLYQQSHKSLPQTKYQSYDDEIITAKQNTVLSNSTATAAAAVGQNMHNDKMMTPLPPAPPTATVKTTPPKKEKKIGFGKMIYNTISAGTKFPRVFLKNQLNFTGGAKALPEKIAEEPLPQEMLDEMPPFYSATSSPASQKQKHSAAQSPASSAPSSSKSSLKSNHSFLRRKQGSASSSDSDSFSIPRPRLIVPVHTYARKRRTGNLVNDNNIDSVKNADDDYDDYIDYPTKNDAKKGK